MSSITANLSPAQRRLMNVLFDTGRAAEGMSARSAKDAAEVGHDEVIGLALADLVEARTAGRGELVDIPSATSSLLYTRGTVLRLTGLGISWCRENPLNALLRALDTAPRGRFDLRDASAVCGDDDVIVSIVSDGYATLHFAGDLRETKFGGTRTHGVLDEIRHGTDYVLIATPKIRTVLGPKA